MGVLAKSPYPCMELFRINTESGNGLYFFILLFLMFIRGAISENFWPRNLAASTTRRFSCCHLFRSFWPLSYTESVKATTNNTHNHAIPNSNTAVTISSTHIINFDFIYNLRMRLLRLLVFVVECP